MLLLCLWYHCNFNHLKFVKYKNIWTNYQISQNNVWTWFTWVWFTSFFFTYSFYKYLNILYKYLCTKLMWTRNTTWTFFAVKIYIFLQIIMVLLLTILIIYGSNDFDISLEPLNDGSLITPAPIFFPWFKKNVLLVCLF